MTATDAAGVLMSARRAFAQRAWREAFSSFSEADRARGLAAGDLERLATAAYMLGRYEAFEDALERAHSAHLAAAARREAGRCALWIGIGLALRGELGPASGWFARARRIVEDEGDCVEQGYLLLPAMMRHEAAGDLEAAAATAVAAVAIAERFGDADLLALALHTHGRVRIRQGAVQEGLALLDEAMVAVVAGELSPIVTGLVYCSVIEGCQEIYELRRAREWTTALTRWCDEQSDLVSFTGKCLMHRSEIMQLRGEWSDALRESRRAGARLEESHDLRAAAQAHYHEAEVLRLRGEFDEAERAYRRASRLGREPQPGLALLRLAEGDGAAAASAIRRVAGETTDPVERTRLLPAYVEIMLAVGEVEEARAACRDLGADREHRETDLLRAMRVCAGGAVDLAGGDAWAALEALRRALAIFEDLGVPHEVARARMLVGMACRALGDEETARLELEAAGAAFRELGAGPDLARLEALAPRARSRDAHGLTPREREVLRLVAAGKSNRVIAGELVISERTVGRHVSNILRTLRLPSRSAATAYAYEHGLV